jgi:hypothetical protein
MQSTVVIKKDLNKLLVSLIGDNKYSLVDRWWASKNHVFDNRTPNELYWSGGEQRQRVIDYIFAQYFGELGEMK